VELTTDTCAYVSLVCDDLETSAQALEKLGFGRVWAGHHPALGATCALLASRSGGILLVADSDHPVVTATRATKERWLHLSILTDASTARERAARAVGAGATVVDFELEGLGSGIFVEFGAPAQGEAAMRVEFLIADEATVMCAGSSIRRIESIAFAGLTRTAFTDPLVSMGYAIDPKTSDADFPSLGGLNSIIWLRDNYLELNEPLAAGGVMENIRKRMGRDGVFGINFEPDDLEGACARWRADGIETNTEAPILLEGDLHGVTYPVCDIVTINPRSTGGGRMFALRPLTYPWELR